MQGQMTIWDFIQVEEDPADIETMTDEYLVKKMQEATGLTFTYDKLMSEALHRNYYKAKVKKRTYELYLDRYTLLEDNLEHNKRFISVGYDESLCGAGAPCDSLDKAIETMRKFIKRI